MKKITISKYKARNPKQIQMPQNQTHLNYLNLEFMICLEFRYSNLGFYVIGG